MILHGLTSKNRSTVRWVGVLGLCFLFFSSTRVVNLQYTLQPEYTDRYLHFLFPFKLADLTWKPTWHFHSNKFRKWVSLRTPAMCATLKIPIIPRFLAGLSSMSMRRRVEAFQGEGRRRGEGQTRRERHVISRHIIVIGLGF